MFLWKHAQRLLLKLIPIYKYLIFQKVKKERIKSTTCKDNVFKLFVRNLKRTVLQSYVSKKRNKVTFVNIKAVNVWCFSGSIAKLLNQF